MEMNDFTDYEIAEITDKDNTVITELEKNLSSKTDKDIVLIAYQPKAKENVIG